MLEENVVKSCVFSPYKGKNLQKRRKNDVISTNICRKTCIIQNNILSLHRSFLVVPEVIQTIRCFFANYFNHYLAELTRLLSPPCVKMFQKNWKFRKYNVSLHPEKVHLIVSTFILHYKRNG